METKVISDVVAFNADKMAKNVLFESAEMFYDLYCLCPGQAQKVHAHEGADKVYYVVSGLGRFTIGEEVASLGPGTAVIARAGVPHGVSNAGPGDLVAIVVMAPKPNH